MTDAVRSMNGCFGEYEPTPERLSHALLCRSNFFNGSFLHFDLPLASSTLGSLSTVDRPVVHLAFAELYPQCV
jgi:hypothetical protein